VSRVTFGGEQSVREKGQFAGATGLITSDFFVGANLEVINHHFGVLFVE
jgi:hypothetical protein